MASRNFFGILLASEISAACAIASGFRPARCATALRPYLPLAVSMSGPDCGCETAKPRGPGLGYLVYIYDRFWNLYPVSHIGRCGHSAGAGLPTPWIAVRR